MADRLTVATAAAPAARPVVISRWLPGWLPPAAITAPAAVTATPETASAGARPNAGSCRQRTPSAEVKAVSAEPDWPASMAPAESPFIRPAEKPAGVVSVAANVQSVPLPERYTSAAGRPPTVAGLTSRNPCAVAAMSENSALAPCPAGTVTGRQRRPPSSLSQAAPARPCPEPEARPCPEPEARPCPEPEARPCPEPEATSPAIRIRFPDAATSLMSCTCPPPAARCSWPPPIRVHRLPSADRKITAVDRAPSGRLPPAARKPPLVRFSTVTSSPGRFGRPVAEASVHARPSALVQTESSPMAAQAPAPPATKRAACPGGGVPPSAVVTPPRLQVRPPSGETKNWARGTSWPDSAPTATTSAPALATRPSDSTMPRVLPGRYGVKFCPARTAGGKLAATGFRLSCAFTTRPLARPRTSTAAGTATRITRLLPAGPRAADPGSGPESHPDCVRRWRPAGRSNSNPGRGGGADRGRAGGPDCGGGAGRGKAGVSGNVPVPTRDGP